MEGNYQIHQLVASCPNQEWFSSFIPPDSRQALQDDKDRRWGRASSCSPLCRPPLRGNPYPPVQGVAIQSQSLQQNRAAGVTWQGVCEPQQFRAL